MGVLVAPVEARRESARARVVRGLGERGQTFALVSAATTLAAGIEGYHPYAEDGGIYLAGVKRLLDQTLYPHDAAFAMEPARWSLFAPTVAAVVRATNVPLPWVLLALHLGSVWLTLYAAWMLAARCFAKNEARAGAVAVLACWLGLPVAGTALYVMDPYLTARSFATPAMLLAIVGAVDGTAWEGDSARRRRGWVMWIGGLAACAMMHPLSALYAGVATLSLVCLRAQGREIRIVGTAALCAMAVAAAACAQMFAAAETAAYVRAALTRSYWFLGEWRWYELVGLAAPLGILGVSGWFSECEEDPRAEAGRAVARMAVVAGLLACVIAVMFAGEGRAVHLVARMQPLRMFQVVYGVMGIVIGAWLGERILQRRSWRWAVASVVFGGAMFGAARAEYRNTSHLELPWMHQKNAWGEAFEWIRANTPKDALFAMDADYIHAPAEDAQNFRAIAERSVLPDASKDGGEASIAPDLAKAWAQGVAAQNGVNTISDSERLARLKSGGVTWVVLEAEAQTALECPYVNASVRVCRLP